MNHPAPSGRGASRPCPAAATPAFPHGCAPPAPGARSPLHGSRLGGVRVAEVVAVGAVAAAVLVGRDVELAHLGAAHAGGAGVGARPLFCPCRRDRRACEGAGGDVSAAAGARPSRGPAAPARRRVEKYQARGAGGARTKVSAAPGRGRARQHRQHGHRHRQHGHRHHRQHRTEAAAPPRRTPHPPLLRLPAPIAESRLMQHRSAIVTSAPRLSLPVFTSLHPAGNTARPGVFNGKNANRPRDCVAPRSLCGFPALRGARRRVRAQTRPGGARRAPGHKPRRCRRTKARRTSRSPSAKSPRSSSW